MSRRDLSCIEFWARSMGGCDIRLAIACSRDVRHAFFLKKQNKYKLHHCVCPHATGSLMSRRNLSCVEFWARTGVTLDLRLAIARQCRFLYDP